ncbi:hypothetical protein BFW01_g6543 [Lasiodiplodia theobromae]|nr:hypothetical protein BFW01_g6543 [Lasiodiplodia theobromae]
MVVEEKAEAPKKRRSVADFATQVVKDTKGTLKRMRRPKSTATIATSPPPVEESSSDKPEEKPSEPQPRTPWIDPSDMKGPVEDEEDKTLHMGRPPGAAPRSNLAAFFWSRLELLKTSL